MGKPEFDPSKIPVLTDDADFINKPMEIGGILWNVTALSVGNPHAVVFVDNVDWLDLPTLGPLFENHPLFPERINTEFVQVIDRGTLKMRDGNAAVARRWPAARVPPRHWLPPWSVAGATTKRS
jgi:diaminopimelate epimerase